MSLQRRISRLFKADVHSILDSLEDPRAVLAQAIRDMHEQIVNEEERSAALLIESEELHKRYLQVERICNDTTQQVELCIRNENDTLAKAVIRKKLENERLRALIKRQIESNEKERATLSDAITKQRSTLEEFKEKAALYSEPSTDTFDGLGFGDNASPISESQVEIVLLAEKERLRAHVQPSMTTFTGDEA